MLTMGAFSPRQTATNSPSTEEFAISDKTAAPDFATHFSHLTDPRMSGKCRHELIDIVTITILAVMCGANELTQVQLWGEHNQDWLEEFLELPNGIPSHDTFGRVLGLIDAEEFALGLSQWMQALAGSLDGEIVAIDGKTLRGSFDKKSGLKRLHLINAWARDNGLVLGQVACENGSGSEPKAVLKLLEILDIQGAVVTLDAGCVTQEIVKAIDQKGADFTVAIKGNQPKLYQAACELFEQHRDTDFAQIKHRLVETEEHSHGRDEYRAVHVLSLPPEGVWDQWPGARLYLIHI
jgi:predicted transposase YbfD/YdcC